MAPPSLPPAAEALFRAHQDKSTGWLTLLCGGREAKLYVQFGDLVGARLGFGHQTDAQALLAAGALVPPVLDTLWSRGQLGDPARVHEAAGVDPTSASELRALASVRRVALLAEEASFMPALVEITFPRVRGARAVRAAFEALPPGPGDGVGSLPRPVRRRALPRQRRRADLPRLAGRVPHRRGALARAVGAAPRAGARGPGGDPRARGVGGA